MIRRSRSRRIAKWTGVVVCVVLAGVWVASLRSVIGYQFGSKMVCVLQGDFRIYFGSASPTFRNLGFYYSFDQNAWSSVLPSFGPFIIIPVWFSLIATALPTAYLFYRDRRPPRGHCQKCGYNLQGNVSGTCPECGNEVVITQ